MGQGSHHAAWKDYIDHHIVSEHARRTIGNFLAAAECSPEDVEADENDGQPAARAEVDVSWVDVAAIDRLTAGEGFQYSKRSAETVRDIVEQWTTPGSAEHPVLPRHTCLGMTDPGQAPAAITHDASSNKTSKNTRPQVEFCYKAFRSDLAQSWLNALGLPGGGPVPSP